MPWIIQTVVHSRIGQMMRSKMDNQARRFDANGNDVTDSGNLEDAIRVVEEHQARAAAGDPQAQQLIQDAQARMRDKMEADGSLSATGAAGPQLVGEDIDPEPQDDSSEVGVAAEGDESKVNPTAEPLAETTISGTARNDGGSGRRTRT